jgi:HK97 family phage portal protein
MNRFLKISTALAKSWDDVFLRNRQFTGMADEQVIKDAYEKSDLVYICISTTARAISQVPLIVHYQESRGNWVPVEEGSPLYIFQELLDKPNPILNRFSFIESICSFLLIDGIVWVIGYPPGMVIPLSLYVINKKYMKPSKAPNSNQLLGWRYSPSAGNYIDLNIEDVADSKFFNPYDPLDGFAPIRAGKLSVVTDYKAARFNSKFFDQGATIGGTISTDQKLNEKVRARLEQEIDKKYTGYDKAWKMMLLEQGLKFQQTSPSHKDMMFPQLRELDKERILQIYGMKKSIISITDDLNFATAKEQRRAWWHDTNLPIMRLITASLNHTFFEKNGLYVDFDYSSVEALQEDFTEKVDNAKKLIEMGFTANEVNEKLELGFEEKPWRDYAFISSNMRAVGETTDLESALNGNGMDEEKPDEEKPDEEKPDEEKPPKPKPKPNDDEEDDDNKEFVLITNDFEKSDLWEAKAEKEWRGIAEKAKPIEQKFESKVSKAFFEYRQKVLEWLHSQQSKSNPFVLTRPYSDIDELALKPFGKLKKEADNLYYQSLMEGLKTLALDTGEGLDIELLNEPEAIRFLENKVISLVGPNGIQKTMSRQINQELIKGIEKGESIEEIASRIRRKFTFAAARAKTIARTEVYGSMNYSRNLGIKNSPFTKEIWYTSLDERVRPSHQAMHGKTKKVVEQWVVGGASLEFPGDPVGPAGEVINCRCIVVPFIG